MEALAEIVAADRLHGGTIRPIGAALTDFVQHVAAIYQGTVSDDVITTGLRDLDERTGSILAKCQATKKRLERAGHRLDLVIVDYLKFLHASDRYAGQRHYEVGEITASLKQLARQLNCVVLLCAQLNREVERRNDKRPQLSDQRESGDIEADSDLVLLLYRESYYLQNDPGLQTDPEKMLRLEEVEHRLEIIVAKNRLGPTTTIPAYVDLEFSAVRDLALDRGQP